MVLIPHFQFHFQILFSDPLSLLFLLTMLRMRAWNSPALLLATSDQKSREGTKAKPI